MACLFVQAINLVLKIDQYWLANLNYLFIPRQSVNLQLCINTWKG